MTDIWTSQELADYVQDGYNDLAMRTGCLWATDVAPDLPSAFNSTATWESVFFVGGDIVSGSAQFTSAIERDFLDNAAGPANHNYRWEYVDGHVVGQGLPVEISALVDLPIDLYEIERSTWNTIRLDATRSRTYEEDDSRYELSKGQVEAYTQDKDGLRRLRKWRVPSAAYVPYTMDSASTDYGILVDVSDVDSATPQGDTWGDFVQVGGEHVMGDPWGVICAIYKEPNNMRIEYRRRGAPLSDVQDLEIPTRYQVYVRHYAQARALEREGDGQDLDLAEWYQARYEAGVQRMLKRKTAMNYQRQFVMGRGQKPEGRLPLARMPWAYGKVVRP